MLFLGLCMLMMVRSNATKKKKSALALAREHQDEFDYAQIHISKMSVEGIYHASIWIDGFQYGWDRKSEVHKININPGEYFDQVERIKLPGEKKAIYDAVCSVEYDWQGKKYDLLERNCTDFVAAVLRKVYGKIRMFNFI